MPGVTERLLTVEPSCCKHMAIPWKAFSLLAWYQFQKLIVLIQMVIIVLKIVAGSRIAKILAEPP